MIKINLLPHREARRKQLKSDFYSLLLLAAILAVVVIITVGLYYSQQLTIQNDRIEYIKGEIKVLDGKIAEIADLKQEIEALRARQEAVEDLQGDRNQPVYLMDELVKLTPEGVFLKTINQQGQRVMLEGFAQSQDRVAEYMRNLGGHSEWLYKPELVAIKAQNFVDGKKQVRVSDFKINVGIKRPREKEENDGTGKKEKSTTK